MNHSVQKQDGSDWFFLIFALHSSHRFISNASFYSFVTRNLEGFRVNNTIGGIQEMAKKTNPKAKKLKDMSAGERAAAGARNPHPAAKARTRYAYILLASRR